MDQLALAHLDIQDVLRFRRLSLSFTPGINVICGANGVGKTALLEAIALCGVRNYHHERVKERADSEDSSAISAKFIINNEPELVHVGFRKSEHQVEYSQNQTELEHLIVNIRAARDFPYQRQTTVHVPPEVTSSTQQQQLINGLTSSALKAWLVNRFMFQGKTGWTEREDSFFESAKAAFSVLDPSVKFSHVDGSTFDVMVETFSGIIPFEYLSSGFRSILALLVGLISEVQLREFGSLSEFGGIILIDEIDLHLHPSWQSKVLRVLSAMFPASQIIVSTHSPHVIQSAAANEVIALVPGPLGEPEPRSFKLGRFGFKGWTLEEILTGVMGLDDVITPELNHALLAFDRAVDADDAEQARENLKILNEMLHPSSYLRKLLRIQAVTLLGPGTVLS